MRVYNRSQLQWSVVQEWLYFGDEDPVTFMGVEAISWENPPYLTLDHAQWVRTIMHDPMTKRVRVSR